MIEVLNIYLEEFNSHNSISLCKLGVVCKELNRNIEEWNIWNKCKFIKSNFDISNYYHNNPNNKNKMITATDCKKEWYLNDNDLLNLNVISTYNKKYKKMMRLYYKNEIIEYVLIKYGGSKKFYEFINNKINNKNKRFLNKADKINKRKELLIEKLKEHNLTLRNDSVVCDDYINGIRDDINEVVMTMVEMNYYMTKTNYKSIMNELMNDLKKDIRNNYGYLHPNEYNKIIKDEIPDLSAMAKKLAISNEK